MLAAGLCALLLFLNLTFVAEDPTAVVASATNLISRYLRSQPFRFVPGVVHTPHRMDVSTIYVAHDGQTQTPILLAVGVLWMPMAGKNTRTRKTQRGTYVCTNLQQYYVVIVICCSLATE